MYADDGDLDQILRQGRKGAELSPEFRQQTMKKIMDLDRRRPPAYDFFNFRTAGVSLVVAGIMLMLVNSTSLGQDLNAATATIRQTTSKIESCHVRMEPAMELWGKIWQKGGK